MSNPLSQSEIIALLDLLNLDHWKAFLFVNDPDSDTLLECDIDHDITDPLITRREQWIVAGDQYLFIERDENGDWTQPELGEWEMQNTVDGSNMVEPTKIASFEDLRDIIVWRINDGQRDEIHPVILAALGL